MKKVILTIVLSLAAFVLGFYTAMMKAIPSVTEDGLYEIDFCGFVFLYE